MTHEPNIVNTTPGSHIRGNTLRAFSLGDREVDLLLPDTGRYLLIASILLKKYCNKTWTKCTGSCVDKLVNY